MKNILIPTIFEEDTLYAVKTAINQTGGKGCSIILMHFSEQLDSYSASGFIRSMNKALTGRQSKIIDDARLIASSAGNCSISIHHQYGITGPLLKNLLEHYSIGLIILLPSFKSATASVHRQCLKLLANCKNSILHLTPGSDRQELSKALYLEEAIAQLDVAALQQVVSRHFNLKIVSRATVTSEMTWESLGMLLSDTIEKNNIDLLIETRRSEKKISKKKKETLNDTLGLPVLSIYEEVTA